MPIGACSMPPSLSASNPNQLADRRAVLQAGSILLRLNLPQWLLIGAAICVLPMIIWGVPNGPDLPSHLRFAQAFSESIEQGNIYPAWQHEANAGFGDGSFRIYPPLLYYALFVSHLFVRDWFLSLSMVACLFAIAGACSVFYCVKGWGNRSQA